MKTKTLTPEQRIQASLADIAKTLREQVRLLRALRTEVEKTESYKECSAAWDAGDDERYTLGWSIHGAISCAIEDFPELITDIYRGAKYTPEICAKTEAATRARMARARERASIGGVR